LVENANSFAPGKDERVGLLAWNRVKSEKQFAAVRCLSERQDLREAAANLFHDLRELDDLDIDLIVVVQFPVGGSVRR
jgi:hypothetical protein